MGKLRGGSGVQLNICGCSVIKLQTHYMVLLKRCPLASVLPFPNMLLTTFQSGIISIATSSSFFLLCPTLSICPHFCFSTSPDWLHANTLHFCCLTPCISVFSWPACPSIYIYTAQHHLLLLTLCSRRHLWLQLEELSLYDLCVCLCVSQQRTFFCAYE